MRIPDSQLSGLDSFDLKTLFADFNAKADSVLGTPQKASNAVPTLLARPTAPVVTAPTPVASKSFLQTIGDGIQQLTPSLVTVANTAIAIKSQDKLAKLNVQRAAAGQAPIDIATYNEANAPVIKIQGGVDSGTSNKLMYGGIAVGVGLVLLLALRKKG